MRRILFILFLAGAMLAPVSAAAQSPGEMLFDQGCDAFDLVDDLGSVLTPLGQTGRWLMRDLSDDSEVVYSYETIDLEGPPPSDPNRFGGVSFVASEFEGTGIRGTNRSEFSGTIDPATFDFTGFFSGKTFRGTRYKTGGISGQVAGSFATGDFEYVAVRMVLCKNGLGG